MEGVNSSHGGTFSEGIPYYNFVKSSVFLEKCINCDSENCVDNKCVDCGFGYDGELLSVKNNINNNNNIKHILNYSICTCGNRMGLKSKICKECYNKYKTNGEI